MSNHFRFLLDVWHNFFKDSVWQVKIKDNINLFKIKVAMNIRNGKEKKKKKKKSKEEMVGFEKYKKNRQFQREGLTWNMIRLPLKKSVGIYRKENTEIRSLHILGLILFEPN